MIINLEIGLITKNILVRADSSSIIGTGHIMRDLVLAKQYPNANITFATQDLNGNINNKIKEAGYKLKILKNNNIKELNKLIKKLQINMLVIDHYDINYTFEKQLKTKNKTLKILSFDDTYKKHYCDILLNHNIYAQKSKYTKLVPKQCEVLCGKKYTLIRDEFKKEKKKIYTPNKKQTIFLAMGGSDASNINIKILKVLKQFKSLKINLVTTSANNNLKQLEEYCKNKKWINLHINSTSIAKLMAKSNLAIVTPSVTLNEVYFIKLPFIAIKTASNQENMYKFLKEKKYPVMNIFKKNILEKKIQKWLYNNEI